MADNWFETLNTTLAHEGVLTAPALRRSVPWQAYDRSMEAWKNSFSEGYRLHCQALSASSIPLGATPSISHTQQHSKPCVRVFVDGVEKKSGLPGDDGVALDKAIHQALVSLGFEVEWIDVSQVCQVSPAELHASMEHMVALRARLCAGNATQAPCLVVGSGSLTDLVKHALHLENLEVAFFVLPTALTVTAFTSAFAVLDESGAKRTRMSREVTAVFWLEPVLQCAPTAMARAGYGDLLARFVAYADWYLGYKLGVMERYDELAFRLMEPFAEGLRQIAPGFAVAEGNRLEAQVTACTAAALSMAGIAMSVSGETTPLSGFEHVISHGLDFLRLTSHRPLVLHGAQVALATLTSAQTLDALCALPDVPTRKLESLTEAQARRLIRKLIKQAPFFGNQEADLARSSSRAQTEDLAPKTEQAIEAFTSEYLKKNAKWLSVKAGVPELLVQEWDAIRAKLLSLTARASEIEQLLVSSNLPLAPEDLEPSTSALEYRWAVRFSPFVRARVSLADVVFWLGEDPAIFAAL